MPNVESHTPGNFCWVELATNDQPGLDSPAATAPRCDGGGHYRGFRNRRRAR